MKLNESAAWAIIISVLAISITVGVFINNKIDNNVRIKAIENGCSVANNLTIICPKKETIPINSGVIE